MKKLKFLALFLIITSEICCYTINEYDYLNINFNDNKLNTYFFEKYIDSVHNRNLIIPDTIKDIFLFGEKLTEQERLIYFDHRPKEWYIINLSASPCWIESIYNKELSIRLINNRDSLGKKELKRVEMRFRNEILKPAEDYGKAQHLPDSILYNKYK